MMMPAGRVEERLVCYVAKWNKMFAFTIQLCHICVTRMCAICYGEHFENVGQWQRHTRIFGLSVQKGSKKTRTK